jgi:exosortase
MAARAGEITEQTSVWLLCLKCVAALCIVGWIASESLRDLLSLGFNDPESSQVLLAPVVIAWLVWVRRGRIARCSLRGRWTGVFIIAAGWLLWSQGYHYQIQSFWHFGAILLLAGSLLVLLGADALWNFLPAWGALIFLVPIPGRVHLQVAVPLERITAIMTQSLAEVLGINASRSGNQLTVNGIDVCIVEACNGLRMVFSLFMACYVFAFVRPLRPWVRFVVLAAGPVVAIVCNVIRLVPTVWMFGNAPPPSGFMTWPGGRCWLWRLCCSPALPDCSVGSGCRSTAKRGKVFARQFQHCSLPVEHARSG